MVKKDEFNILMKDILEDEKSLRMKRFIQHGKITTYDHCHRVARLSYTMSEKLKIKCDKRRLVRGAFLHDYFLYDWHKWKGKLHGFSHAKAAAKNARRDFGVNEDEAHIIESHMWPLNLFSIPRSREAWLVCLADKICSLHETFALR